MLKQTGTLILFIVLTGLLMACATKALKDGQNVPRGDTEKSGNIFDKNPSDLQIFEEAVSYLSNDKKEPNYKEAKIRLENLIATYPKSRWIPASQAILVCLDKISALQVQIRQEKQKEHAKMTKEIEGIKDSAKQNEEKNSTEIIRLQQENEQLKKDIQQLKNLEIQLERREKMLR